MNVSDSEDSIDVLRLLEEVLELTRTVLTVALRDRESEAAKLTFLRACKREVKKLRDLPRGGRP